VVWIGKSNFVLLTIANIGLLLLLLLLILPLVPVMLVNGSAYLIPEILVIATKLEVKYRLHSAAILLFTPFKNQLTKDEL